MMAKKITNQPTNTTGRTFDGYCAKLIADRKTPRLLVEGRFDRLFFKKLIDHLITIKQYPNALPLLETLVQQIDCAENLEMSGNNRERVEAVCQFVDNQPTQSIRFVGFVDREYREFDLPNRFIDQLGCHHQVGCAVWSRGHSLENYFFVPSLLIAIYADYGQKARTDETIKEAALKLFAQFFDEGLYHALCVGMVASELKIAHKDILATLTADCFDGQTETLLFKESEWLPKIAGKTKQQQDSIENNLTKWQTRLKSLSISCYQYICHGHIGERILFNLFLHTINCVSDGKSNARKSIETTAGNENDRFIDYSNGWIARQLWKTSDSPIIVLQKLELI